MSWAMQWVAGWRTGVFLGSAWTTGPRGQMRRPALEADDFRVPMGQLGASLHLWVLGWCHSRPTLYGVGLTDDTNNSDQTGPLISPSLWTISSLLRS